MLLKYHFLCNIFAFLVTTQTDALNFCYRSAHTGFRLNATVIQVRSDCQWIGCVIECAKVPCCRSVNYKKMLPLEKGNCEMLHDVVDSTSTELLQENASYSYIYLTNPMREFNESCLSKNLEANDKDIDECFDNTKKTCDPNANCTNTVGSYVCQCFVGFSGNGTTCTDIDECLDDSNNTCDPNANCINTVGSYRCRCKIGYSGDGKTCTVVHILDSVILEGEAPKFKEHLREWLPSTGNWSACWRASRDGWDVETKFHPRCDGEAPTLTIVKVFNNIFGGYATTSWAENVNASGPGSFIFSLRNSDALPPLSAPLKDQNGVGAIIRESTLGPTFGGGYDLCIANNANSNADSYTNFDYTYQAPPGYSYGYYNTKSLLAGSYEFTPSEVEVLYLTV